VQQQTVNSPSKVHLIDTSSPYQRKVLNKLGGGGGGGGGVGGGGGRGGGGGGGGVGGEGGGLGRGTWGKKKDGLFLCQWWRIKVMGEKFTSTVIGAYIIRMVRRSQLSRMRKK